MAQQIWRRVSKSTGRVSYQVKIVVGKKRDGKPKFITRTFAKKKEADAFRRKILSERDQGFVSQPTLMTVDEYLDRWLEDVAQPRMRKVTFDSYVSTLRLYIRPGIGERRMKNVNGMILQGVYSSLLERGLSARTVRYAHSIVNSAFRQAVKWRLIPRNPCENVQLPRQMRQEMNALSPEEAVVFLQAARQDRLGALFDLAVTSGMRPGEYTGLKWMDVGFEAGTVTVRRTLVLGAKGEWRLAEPKTSRSRRTIPLPKGTLEILRRYKVAQAEERMKAPAKWNDHGFVFTTKYGQPVNRNNLVKRNFLRILKAASLGEWVEVEGTDKKRFVPKIRLYDLRHTCATLLLAAGENPKVVSERLGHASVSMTLDTYSHVLPTMQEAAAERLDSMLYSGA